MALIDAMLQVARTGSTHLLRASGPRTHRSNAAAAEEGVEPVLLSCAARRQRAREPVATLAAAIGFKRPNFTGTSQSGRAPRKLISASRRKPLEGPGACSVIMTRTLLTDAADGRRGGFPSPRLAGHHVNHWYHHRGQLKRVPQGSWASPCGRLMSERGPDASPERWLRRDAIATPAVRLRGARARRRPAEVAPRPELVGRVYLGLVGRASGHSHEPTDKNLLREVDACQHGGRVDDLLSSRSANVIASLDVQFGMAIT